MPGKKVKGILAQDANDVYLQMPCHIKHTDGTTTPQTSPLAAVGTSPTEIKIPDGALYLYLRGRDAGIKVGEIADFSTGYEALYQGEWSPAIPIADKQSVFVAINAVSGTTAVDFRFECLGVE